MDDKMTVADLNNRLAGAFGFVLDMVPPGDLIPYANNPKKHKQKDLSALHKSVEAFGFKDVIIVDKDLEIIEGHGRQIEAVNKGLDSVLVLKALDLDKKQANALRTAANRIVELSTWDERLLVTDALPAINEVFGGLDDLQWERYADTLIPDLAMEDTVGIVQGEVYADPSAPIAQASMGIGASEPIVALAPNDDGSSHVPVLTRKEEIDVPDAAFPSDNEWDVPTLSLKYQADFVELPFYQWGDVARKSVMRGTWHFYTDDSKFEVLWNDPTGPLQTNASTIVEPNFSTGPQFPRGAAMCLIFRKRWLSRFWQSHGKRIIVDINIDPRLYDLAVLGVPRGWRAWATRGQPRDLDTLYMEHEVAVNHAGTDDILFVVYAGGKTIEDVCKQEGWIFIPDRMTMDRETVKQQYKQQTDDEAIIRMPSRS